MNSYDSSSAPTEPELRREDLCRERNRLAREMERTRGESEEIRKELHIVKRIAGAISQNFDQGQICLEVVNLTIEETDAENCSLWLKSFDDRTIYIAAARGSGRRGPTLFDPDKDELTQWPIGTGIVGKVAQTGGSIIVENVAENPLFIDVAASQMPPIKSLLCIPIKCKNRVLGVLNMSHPQIGVFSKKHERTLRLITDQAGLILTNGRLINEIGQLNQRLERQVGDRTEDLAQIQECYERAIQAGRVGLWDWKIGSEEMYVAPNLKGMLGYEPDDKPRNLRDWLKMMHVEDREKFFRDMEHHVRNKTTVYESEQRMFHRNGELVWFFVRGKAIRDKDGKLFRLSGSNTDITQRKRAELKLAKARKDSLAHAHAAGKAEIAATVLHNIGNVLNSLNVNHSEMKRRLLKMKLPQMFLAFQMIQDHRHDLAGFFESDPKGIRLPEYFEKISHLVQRESQQLFKLLEDLGEKVELMRCIVDTQQNHAGELQAYGPQDLARLLEEALKIQQASIDKRNIRVHKSYLGVPPIEVPPSRMIHVFINLLKNALEALEKRRDAEITLRLMQHDNGDIRLEISDNGEGISGADMERLFTQGFTTKRTGQGLGLYFCAKTLEEMGATIQATSEGFNRGATFTLIFPNKLQQTGLLD